MGRELITNVAQTTTTGAINNSSDPVTVPLTSATLFPTSGNFHIKIDTEILLITAVSGLNLTASRAQEGTTIASHASGATVSLVVTAQSLKNLINERVVTAEMTPPDDATFSWVNQGTATVGTGQGWPYLSDQGQAADECRHRVKSTPAAPFTKTICFHPNFNLLSDAAYTGLVLRESGSGGFVILGIKSDAGGGAQIVISEWSDNNTMTTELTFPVGEAQVSGRIWLRVEDDSTDLIFSHSNDGHNFNLFHSEGNTVRYTFDQYGFMLNPNSDAITGANTGVNILSLD